MSFFGLSSQGKNSRGQLENIPYILQDQMNNAFKQGAGQQQQGAGYTQQYVDYLNSILNDPNGGFFSPDQITQYGNQAMPGVDAANTDRMARLNGLPTPISGADTTSALQKINDQRNADYLSQLNGTITGARDNTNRDYGGMRQLSQNAYSDATKNVQRLLPTGDLAAAAAARSFAPAMAASQRRLRASGIDPNSPEASGILQSVDVARGHSMDDTMAANQGNYINQLNSMVLGGMNDQNALTKAQTDITRQLGLTQGSLTMDNTNNNAGINSGIATGGRNMSIQDQQLAQQLADLYNNANLQNIGLQNQRFNAGTQGLGLGLQQRNNAAGSLGQLGTTLTNQGQAALNSGQGFARDASSGFGENLGIEGANAGWGTKMLAGLAGGALNMFAPGAGTALTSGIMGAAGLNAPAGGYNAYAGTPQSQSQQNPYGGLMGSIGNLFKTNSNGYMGGGAYSGASTPFSGYGGNYTFS